MRRVLWLVASGWWLVSAHAQAQTVNRIVAIVNNDVITESDVNVHVHAMADHQDPSHPDSDRAQAPGRVLQGLIQQRLLLQEAGKENLTVERAQVIERLEEARTRAGSDEEFRRSLEEAQLTEEQLKEQIQDQLLIAKLIDEKVRSTITISPQEVAGELANHPELVKSGDRVKALHLLIRVGDQRTEGEAKALIEDIVRQLDAGADFSALAKRYSEDPERAEGGDMGWVAQGELLPELDQALFSVKAGERSAPIRSALGFHLVNVLERKAAASLPLVEANHAVYQRLYQRRFQEAFAVWLTKLKDQAYIEIVNGT